MEDWKKRFEYIYTVEENSNERYLRKYDHRTIVEELEHFIEQEIEKAREEGYKDGVKDGMKGKVFEKIEIETEVHFKDLKDVIEGKEDAGEFLSKLKQ